MTVASTTEEPPSEPIVEQSAPPTVEPDSGPPWLRLDFRMVWIDLILMVLSLIPIVATTVLFDEVVWFAVIAGGLGIVSSTADLLRWVKTRYRLTGELVEYRSGLLVRTYRSVRRDRVRSVDTTARLRHRVAGLRVVNIRSGAQATSAEPELVLDAISLPAAQQLQRELLAGPAEPAQTGAATESVVSADESEPSVAITPSDEVTLAAFRSRWMVHNLFNVWAFVAAVGLVWGVHWSGTTVGFDLLGTLLGLAADLGVTGFGLIPLGILGAGVLGVLALGVNFFTENWKFRLSRVRSANGTMLRTKQGLFKTREINRDDRRLRGVQIWEPLLWRWMGTADTSVISTGMSSGSVSENPSATILPRVGVREARRVAAAVIGDDRPFTTPPIPHPRAALRRRLGWAVLTTAVLTGLFAWLGRNVSFIPEWSWLVALGMLPILSVLAAVGYRSLGHALVGDYLVVRSGLTRDTAVLRREAVIGWTIRESVLQRRLGLLSVTATTAAGYGQYAAIDIGAQEGLKLAAAATPDLVRPRLGGVRSAT
ncbi:PH domain-containing protein [Actinoalloteichus hymeniacidonis]|uniref:Membrane protein n=1 Tax=Actinoalloteichus hymeniacidonis TaxID=340345 RepID=A0AAC9HNX5_9PSEU|nr:PH domain-containing protein [Actinoalloteichus hymeniacidonis]AOS62733.1 putative membrane protein [Actinoalloteichus hymeniacidonis]MBB5909236.1 putative membrane protein [Actinoalloteichus hymeniacidonis]